VSLLNAQLALTALAELRGGNDAARQFLLALIEGGPAAA
jgi:hypothetical protein